MSSAKKAIAHSLYVLKDKERADMDLIFHIGSFAWLKNTTSCAGGSKKL